MLIQKLNGAITLEMYDSIDVMPIENHINYTRLAMLDAGIGSDINSVMQHWTHIQRLCDKGDKDALNRELLNYQQALSFIVENTSPYLMSFVPFIHKINGEVIEDYSDENAKVILERLNKGNLTVGIVDSVLDFIKKKWRESWRHTA